MPSPYVLLANSCDNGPCPTLYVNPDTGDVLVQGYTTTAAPPRDVPAGEDVLHIPAEAWQKLLSQLGR
jgi:hypothetical protein